MSDTIEAVTEEGNSLSPTDTSVAAQAEHVVEPKGAANNQRGAQRPLEDRLQRAEGAIQRHKDNSRKLYDELNEVKQSYSTREAEYKQLRAEMDRIEAIRARIADGDEEALMELGGDLNLFVERKLDPEYARTKAEQRRAQQETDKKMKALEDLIRQKQEREQEETRSAEVRRFVATVQNAADTYPDLVLAEPGEIAQLGLTVAPMLAKELGRAPTFSEIAAAADRILGAYHTKVFDSMSKRERAKAEALAAKELEDKKRGVQKKPAPLPPAPKQANTITTKMAAQTATTKATLTAAERRELAVKKLRALNGE